MKLSIICFTKSGYRLMQSMVDMVNDSRVESDFQIVSACHKCRAIRQDKEKGDATFSYYEKSVEDWAKEQFARHHALLFIGASGIAVRAIASSIKNKLTDSPVLVMDDLGKFVIPLLSGHVGGANELALQLSSLTGAIPVITTATDIHETFAIDVWAKKHMLTIMNKEAIAHVSGKLLAGETVWCQTPDSIYPDPIKPDIWFGLEPPEDGIKDTTLWLQPKEYILGIGCKKGKTEGEIRQVIEEGLRTVLVSMHQICALASIDAKAEEAGILAISEKEGIPFLTYRAEELASLPGEFHESEFVRQQMGVGSVCERAAVFPDHQLVVPKFAKNGVTVALAKKKTDPDTLLQQLTEEMTDISLRKRIRYTIIQ